MDVYDEAAAEMAAALEAEPPEVQQACRYLFASAETVATAPSFRDSFVLRRFILPASRFYEWQQTEKGKQPYSIQRHDGAPMSFAS